MLLLSKNLCHCMNERVRVSIFDELEFLHDPGSCLYFMGQMIAKSLPKRAHDGQAEKMK